MLQKMGFKTGTGLGKHGEGIVEPIEVAQRKRGTGITEQELVKKTFSKQDLFGSKKIKPEISKIIVSAEQRQLGIAKQVVLELEEKRNQIEYQMFVLRGSPFFEPNVHVGGDLDDLLRDLLGSGIFSSSNSDMVEWLERFARHIDTLRDKYDSNPLWYVLDVESVVAGAVVEKIRIARKNNIFFPRQLFPCSEVW